MARNPIDQLRALWSADAKPILWLGAGASCQTEPPLPTLWSLVEGLKNDLNWDDPAEFDDPYQLIDAFVADNGEGELHRHLERAFKPGGQAPKPGALHKSLAKLIAAGRFSLVIDTNYDLLLRRACDELEPPAPYRLSVLDKGMHLPNDDLTRYLALHGTWDDWTSTVLTGESYAAFDSRHPLAVHELALQLRQRRVLFVGCSLQDPRLLRWMAELGEEGRSRLHVWRAVMGPGEGRKLEDLRWEDGRSYAQVLARIKQTELPNFETLACWFQTLATEAEVPIERRLELLIGAGSRWVITALGERVELDPPEFTIAELAQVRALACEAFACAADGTLDPSTQAAIRLAEAQARAVGERLSAALPAKFRERLAKLVGSAAGSEAGTLHLRVAGDAVAVDAVMLLPWELIAVNGECPVGAGQLHLVREVVVEGASELPNDITEPWILAHVAAPESEGMAELDYEAASYGIARALDPLRDFVRFTELGTLEDLADAARPLQPRTTVLHFAGHGSPDGLWFENEDCDARKVSVGELCDQLTIAATRLPAAIWLSCCYGAGPGTGSGHPQEPSVAVALHRHGLPQVLGYFGPIADALAARIDRELFAELVRTGKTVEALRRARVGSKAVIELDRGHGVFPLAWSMLALYHRGPDRRLFDPRSVAQPSRPTRLLLEPQTIQIEGAEGIPVLEHGFIGRRRELAELRKRWKLGARALGLFGLGGLGKTGTMMRFAIVLCGARQTAKEVIAVPVGPRQGDAGAIPPQPFHHLHMLVQEVVAGHPRCPADWGKQMQQVDELEQPEARAEALARALLVAAQGGVVYLDNLETLQEYAQGEDSAAWREPALDRFFATLTSTATGDTVILMTARCQPHGTCGAWLSLKPAGKGEIFRMTAWHDPLRRLPVALREELTEQLDGHPLTVEWLNALLRESPEDITPDAAIGRLRERVVKPALVGVSQKIEHTLLLRELIGRLSDAERALLGECVEARRPITHDVLDRLGEGGPRVIRLGLITRFGKDGWGLHSLVREKLREVIDGAPWTAAGRGVLAEFREAQAREGSGVDLGGMREALDHYVAARRFEDAGRIIGGVSSAMRRVGLYRARLEFLDSVADVEWPGAQRQRWLHESADAALELGDYAGAEGKSRRSVALAERIHGTRQHASVAASLAGLANVLVSLGKYAEAETAYRESIDVKVKAYGTREHPEVAASLAGLANVFVSLGKYAEAELSYRESIDVMVKAYGTREHPDVAASLHGLANVLVSLGKYAEAETAYRESIGVQVEAYGTREHPDVAASLHGLANVLESLGKYAEAETSYRESIDVKVKAYGTREHAEVAASLHGLANVLVRLGKYPEAETSYRESIDVTVKACGTREHASVAASLASLANVLVSLGKYPEAETSYRESIDVKVKAYGTREHAEVAASLHGLANLLASLRKYHEAETSYRESIDVKVKAYGTREHASVAASLASLANVLVSLGEYPEAETSYRESINVMVKAYGTREHVEVAASLHGLANVLVRVGKYSEAEQALISVVDIEERAYGSRRTAATIPTLAMVAQLLLKLGRPKDALPWSSEAWLAATEGQLLLLTVQVGPIHLKCLFANDDHERARELMPQLQDALTQLPENHPAYQSTEALLAQLFAAQES